ncbi:MAG TPA: GNAT family N-acetyltransferase [Planctomycetaceae bacterium]|jgi:predicted acetyltransferase|nr:GNAT family N-acetyltransferase [Planctomycetaceae bacterium]
MSVHIRPISADEVEAFERAIAVPFLFDRTPETSERFRNVFELDRLRAAVDGDQFVATIGAHTAQIAVPGNILPLAATSIITVLPTHRRQGILRALMTDHLAELHRNGEPLAALWASESSIYGRFGYGPACERALARLEKPFARMQEPVDIAGSIRVVERAQAEELFPAIYDGVVPGRPGMLARSENWWKHRVLSDPEYLRRGRTAHRCALYSRDGRPAGYVIYRTRTDYERGATEVRVIELLGIDAAAEKALWQYLFGIDLTTSIHHWNQPVDDSLRWWLEQPRQLERKIEDSLWLRPVDVAAALAGRRYSCAGSLRLRVRDRYCPWNEGVWELVVDSDGIGRCRQVNAETELELTPDVLGMVYLGGHRFVTLGRCGLITGCPDALRRADALFTWNPLPWCAEQF